MSDAIVREERNIEFLQKWLPELWDGPVVSNLESRVPRLLEIPELPAFCERTLVDSNLSTRLSPRSLAGVLLWPGLSS
jgi:hypothetical protein